jgi:hypothetical protein
VSTSNAGLSSERTFPIDVERELLKQRETPLDIDREAPSVKGPS